MKKTVVYTSVALLTAGALLQAEHSGGQQAALQAFPLGIPKAEAAMKQACSVVYDTVTSPSGRTSRVPRRVCQMVTVPDTPTASSTGSSGSTSSTNSNSNKSSTSSSQSTTTTTPSTKTNTTPTYVPSTNNSSTNTKAVTPQWKTYTVSSSLTGLTTKQQELLQNALNNVLLQALWNIKQRIEQLLQ